MENSLLAIAYLIVSSSLIGQSTIDFITTWNTELTVNPRNTIEIRTNNTFSYYDYNVDWGDGSPIENHSGLNSSALHVSIKKALYF
ncbi:MAG: hypothetical protein ACI9AT_001125 [Ulvibacter sp.]|jgi:hypothetical protein